MSKGGRGIKQRRGQLDAVRRDPRVIELALEDMLCQHIADELHLPSWAVAVHLDQIGLYKTCYEIEKMCAHCGSMFLPTMGIQQYCRICVPNGRANSRMKAYGVSQSEVDALLDYQGDKCALCDKDVSVFRGLSDGVGSGNIDAAIDHNHDTGVIRGVLCKKCNLVMAYVDDNEWLQRALIYIEQKLPEGIIVGDPK